MTHNQNNNEVKDIKAKAVIMAVIMLCLLVIGFSACSPKALSHTTNHVQKDSIVTSVNFIHRDTTIVVPGEQLELKVPVYSLTEVPTTIKTSNGMNLSLSKINEEILAQCNTDDLIKIIALQDKLIETYQSTEKVKTETIEVAVKFIPWYIRVLSWIGGITSGYLLGWLIFRIGLRR